MERGIITITENGLVAIPTAPVWMTQQEMSDAFNVFGCDIRKGYTLYLQKHGIVGKRNEAVHQTGQRDKLRCLQS